MSDDPGFRPETLGTYEPTTEEQIDALAEQVQGPLTSCADKCDELDSVIA